MRIFKDIFDSIFNMEAYNRFIQYKGSRKTAYIFLLPLFRILFVALVAVMSFFSHYKSIDNYMQSVIPDFTLSASGLDMEEKVDDVYGNVYIYINTDETMDKNELYYREANNLFVFKDAILLRDSLGKETELDFKDFDLRENESVTRDEFIDNVKSTIIVVSIVITAVLAIFYYIGMVLAYAFTALLLVPIVKLVAKKTGKNLSDKRAFTISLYAKTATFTVTTLIIAVNWILGIYSDYTINIPYFYAIKLIICLIYVYYIVLNIKEEKVAQVTFETGDKYGMQEEQESVWEESVKEKPLQPEVLKPTDSWSFGEKKEDGNE
ncbi:MAG: DUF1189 domain-containing protein [Lachnospiraceae bacterium]|nr:MAG: DUF1189 domain-containing protein [Lachnospiraceae bacterium]